MSSPVRPLVPSAPLSEFGDFHQSAEFNDPHLNDRDGSYVPGFSEMRRNRDIAVATYTANPTAENRTAITPLPVNLRWARNQTKSGSPDNAKPFVHGRKGYRAVDAKQHAGQDWLTEIPPGAVIQADGTIRNGDCILMWAPAEKAAQSERMKQRLTTERIEGVKASFAQHAATAGASRSAEPYVTMEPATTPPESGAKPGRK